LTNAVKLHGTVPTYTSIVVYFPSVQPKHFLETYGLWAKSLGLRVPSSV